MESHNISKEQLVDLEAIISKLKVYPKRRQVYYSIPTDNRGSTRITPHKDNKKCCMLTKTHQKQSRRVGDYSNRNGHVETTSHDHPTHSKDQHHNNECSKPNNIC